MMESSNQSQRPPPPPPPPPPSLTTQPALPKTQTNIGKIKSLLDWLRQGEYKRVDANAMYEKIKILERYASLRLSLREDERSEYEQVFIKGKFANFFREYWAYLKTKEDVSYRLLYITVVKAVVGLTDGSEAFSRCAVQQGAIQLIISDLKLPAYQSAYSEKNNDVMDVISNYVMILHNIINLHSITEGREIMRSAGATQVLKFYATTDWDDIKVEAAFILGAVMNDDEKLEIVNIFSESTIELIRANLSSAFSGDHQESTYSSVELLADIGLIANFSQHFARLLLNKDGLQLFHSILIAPEERNVEKNRLSSAKIHFSTVKEKAMTLKVLWSCAFYDESRKAIKSDSKLIATLENFATKSKSIDLSGPASGILWEITKSDQTSAQNSFTASNASAAGSNPETKNVMISYCWANQEAVLAIYEALEKHGIKTWIDKTDMQGSTIDAMARAVQNASIVIICYSENYFRSPNCRAEAEYAFQCRKRIIPARLQRYNPEDWLGFILGSKLYYDFSSDESSEDGLQKLINELQTSLMSVEGKQAENVLRDSSDGRAASHHQPSSRVKLHPIAQRSSKYDRLTALSREDVQNWLESSGLGEFKAQFVRIDGACLREFMALESRAPQYFYERLERDMKMNLVTVSVFMAAIRKLIDTEKVNASN